MNVSQSGAVAHTADVLQQIASSMLVPLRVWAPPDVRFRAYVERADVGAAVVARLRSTQHTVDRDAHSISSGDRDLFKLILHLSGDLAVRQDGYQARMAPDHLILCDTARPYQLVAPGACDVVIVGLPRSLFGSSADLMCRMTARSMPSDRGTKAVIAAFLTGLADNIDDLPGPAGVRLADALVSLVIAAFTEITPGRRDAGTELVDRILAFASANLHDPLLSAESVARRHGISIRHLHTLLRPRGVTFAAWVRTERLRRIRGDLLDPALAQRTTAAIAARWGLHDPAHLARALKREFGQTAAEIRQTSAAAGEPAAAGYARPNISV
ncbi:MAG TPA: helix-turn-helix domain-containing protein [Streptosporangiaceae bacterium]